MGHGRLLLVLALAAAIATGCEPASGPGTSDRAPGESPGAAAGASGEVVARYGGETLTSEELVVQLERLPERSRRVMNADARAKFVENYVLNELLYADGARQGFADDPDILRQVDDLKKRLVVQKLVRNLQNIPPVTDDEVKAYYEAHPEKFSTTTIKARHVLIKDEAKAKELQAQVKADPSRFAEIAQANSVDTTSARRGGDLGIFGRGRMVPEFETAAFALRAGEVSEVVKTPYGYHVILVEEVREGPQKPFDQVKEQIRATLRSQALQAKTKDYYDELRRRANVSIDQAAIEQVAARVAPKEGEDGAPALPHGHPPVGRDVPGDEEGGDEGAAAPAAAASPQAGAAAHGHAH